MSRIKKLAIVFSVMILIENVAVAAFEKAIGVYTNWAQPIVIAGLQIATIFLFAFLIDR